MASKKMPGGTKKAGRPFGESSNSGRGLMMSESRPFGSSASMKIKGRPARSNGVKNLKGRATKDWSGDPNRTHSKKN